MHCFALNLRPIGTDSVRTFRNTIGEEAWRVDIEALGSFVRAQRKERRLTQLEVAELADVSDRFLRELEHGKPTAEIGKVIEVLAVLGYDLEPVVHKGDLL
ncbi:anaerobic benzoate catabolism transcriptional regulator [Corynebacterium jeddahense]|uniref:Anaerobic benzoate catabolism transcriptional regulator n=1 Tax=Corynebacterium jeddahense TaxID=1414719 RepID=A0ABY7UQ79_9CORY|nr:anaerobic benzoate catabolism transcriptional regulator [Corynebacterium jeddahense]